MYAIVCPFDPSAEMTTRQIWQYLAQDCGLNGIQWTPLPHFSWLGAEEMDCDRVCAALDDFTRNEAPFNIRTAGLGLFTGPKPVLYLTVAKSRLLLEIHERLSLCVDSFIVNPNRYYAPVQWVPHITLAYRDLNAENLGCAVKNLISYPLEVDIHIQSIALVYSNGEDHGVIKSFPLRGRLTLS